MIASTNSSGTQTGSQVNISPQVNPQIIKSTSRELFLAYQNNETNADAIFKGKYIKITCLTSNWDKIIDRQTEMHKDIGDAFAIDGVYRGTNNDPNPKFVESNIEKMADNYKISSDYIKSTIPSISMYLGIKNRKAEAGKSSYIVPNRHDVLFVFDTHPEDLDNLVLGKMVNIVGRVEGLHPTGRLIDQTNQPDPSFHQTIVMRDCRFVK
jgi:hypothetical protein